MWPDPMNAIIAHDRDLCGIETACDTACAVKQVAIEVQTQSVLLRSVHVIALMHKKVCT